MNASEAETLIMTIKGLVDTRSLSYVGTGVPVRDVVFPSGGIPGLAGGDEPWRFSLNADEFERLYLRIKNRLIDEARIDPILLQLLTQRPELVVEVEPRVVTLDASNMKGRVARLMAAGWFASTRATSAVRKELTRTGADPGGGGGLSDVLGAYVKDGFLVREGEGYTLAPGVKVTERAISTL